MPTNPQHRFLPASPRHSAQERYAGDLDYKDTVFIYSVVMEKGPLGEDTESWGLVPTPIRASVQEHALDSEHDDIVEFGSRFSRVFTRYRNFVSWHDKMIFRGIEMLVVKVIERFDNFDGSYHHTEIRAKYLEEPGSIRQDR